MKFEMFNDTSGIKVTIEGELGGDLYKIIGYLTSEGYYITETTDD